MTVLVLGANGSGKSVYAEKFAVSLQQDATRYYIATMIPFGEEGRVRVKKHLKQRAHMGFITVEKPVRVAEISFSDNAVVLLEDVSNALSNEMFCGGARAATRDAVQGALEKVFCDITSMCAKCRHSVLVSIDGLIDSPEYDAETGEYIRALNSLNAKLSRFADTLVRLEKGVPVIVKSHL